MCCRIFGKADGAVGSEGTKGIVFFKRLTGKGQVIGKCPGNVADVPRLPGKTSNVFFSFGIADDEPKKRSISG